MVLFRIPLPKLVGIVIVKTALLDFISDFNMFTCSGGPKVMIKIGIYIKSCFLISTDWSCSKYFVIKNDINSTNNFKTINYQ